jgi:hypothetical protein
MSPTATERGPRGQVLPLGLAMLACGVLLCGLCLRLGARLMQQERLAMRTDLTAYSGGIQVARSLNILSYSEKIRMAGELIGDIPLPITKAIGAGMDKAVAAFQKAFIPAVPWVIEADVVAVGLANETGAIPLWNQADALSSFSPSSLKPDLKVDASGSGGGGQSSSSGNNSGDNSAGNGGLNLGSLSSLDLGGLGKLLPGGGSQGGDDGQAGDGYHYQSGDGERHDLDPDQAGAVTEHGPHGTTVTRYKDDSSHKYVAKDKGKPSSGHGMTDEGGHYLAVLAIQTPDDQQPGLRPGLSIGCAQVRIAGGDVNAFDAQHGADYGVFFVPVRGGSDGDGGASNSGGWDKALGLARQAGLLPASLAPVVEACVNALQVQH